MNHGDFLAFVRLHEWPVQSPRAVTRQILFLRIINGLGRMWGVICGVGRCRLQRFREDIFRSRSIPNIVCLGHLSSVTSFGNSCDTDVDLQEGAACGT